MIVEKMGFTTGKPHMCFGKITTAQSQINEIITMYWLVANVENTYVLVERDSAVSGY